MSERLKCFPEPSVFALPGAEPPLQARALLLQATHAVDNLHKMKPVQPAQRWMLLSSPRVLGWLVAVVALSARLCSLSARQVIVD